MTIEERIPPSEPLTREALYALVWAEPMLKVAGRFGVSSSYLARVCTLLKVPRPERGYWAKLAVGRAPPVPDLPESRPGDEVIWSRSEALPKRPRTLPRAPRKAIREPTRATSLSENHGLLTGSTVHFEAGRASAEVGYLKPSKRLLVDLVVSAQTLTKALGFANQLFMALEAYDHRVTLAPSGEFFQRRAVEYREDSKAYAGYNEVWSPARPTVVYIGTVAIGLTVIEMAEHVAARYVDGKYIRESEYTPPSKRRRYAERTWTTQKSFASGRLCLQAYSPYRGTEWARRWHEKEGTELGKQVPIIVKELQRSATEIARLVEVAEQHAEQERERWEFMQQEWKRKEAEARAAKALKDSKEELLAIIDAWVRDRRIEEFFQNVELQSARMPDDERSRLTSRLQLGRQLIGDVNPVAQFAAWKAPDERS